jgi:hypothetical protein
MCRVPALDAQILRRLMLKSNLNQLLRLLTILTEVRTKTTLSILNLSHDAEPFLMSEAATRPRKSFSC